MNAGEHDSRRLPAMRAVCRGLAVLLGMLGLAAVGAAPLRAQGAGPDKWVVPERRAQLKNPLTASAANLQAGRALYLRECSSCHGLSGNNDGRTAPKSMSNSRKHTDPTLLKETDGALFWKIAQGRGEMPSTRGQLSDNERWLLVLYLRTLTPEP